MDATSRFSNAAGRCPSADDLIAYSLGDVAPEVWTTISTHVEQCTTCQSTLAEVGNAADSLIVALRSPPPSGNTLEAAMESALEPARQILQPQAQEQSARASARSDRTEDPLLGRLISQYELLERLGRGGGGVVYRALHTRLDRTVTLKILSAEWFTNRDAVARFQREMQAVGRLDQTASRLRESWPRRWLRSRRAPTCGG